MAKMGSVVRDESMAFSQEISRAGEASLNPLQEDLAEWLSRVLDVKISSDKFMDSLSNGALVCKLAQLIQDKAVECRRAGKAVKELPQKKIKCFRNASPESFFARDNVANFLGWCRTIGLEDTCLFETEGLVLKKDPKNVLVCIYELARVAGHYGIEPPGLVKLEKEIAKEVKNPRPKSSVTPAKKSKRSTLDIECIKQRSSKDSSTNPKPIQRTETDGPPPPSPLNVTVTKTISVIIPSPTQSIETISFPSPSSPQSIEIDTTNPLQSLEPNCSAPLSPPHSIETDESTSSRFHSVETIDSVGIETTLKRRKSKTPKRKVIAIWQEILKYSHKYTIPQLISHLKGTQDGALLTALQKKPIQGLQEHCKAKVQNVAKTCDFPLELQRISEGRYNIGGKVVFIRMLRGRHIMVRVGGGWDTLQHFLMKHESVKVDKVDRSSIVSLDGDAVPDQFYVVQQAKYKGKGEV